MLRHKEKSAKNRRQHLEVCDLFSTDLLMIAADVRATDSVTLLWVLTVQLVKGPVLELCQCYCKKTNIRE